MPGVGPMSAMAIQAFCPLLRILEMVAILLLGSVWFRDNTQPAARIDLDALRRWVSGICESC